jgi:hypothetical protein
MRSPTRIMAAATLSFEAVAVFLSGLVAKDLTSLSTGAAIGFASGLAVLCLLTAGLLRSPLGYGLGSVLQVLVICSGIWVHAMYFVGGLFALLWAGSLVYGTRIEREVRERTP